MADLYLGILLMFSVSALLFMLGYWIAGRSARWGANILGSVTIVGLVGYAVYLRDHVVMARLFPFSNLIILANWFPLAVGFLGGLAFVRVYGGLFRRSLYTLVLVAVGLYATVQPILGSPPACENQWLGDVCIQTSQATCSAACAATVLRAAGIEATEGEMAALCLTRRGTTWQGLYRGLKLKTRGTRWDVEVFSCPASELREHATTPTVLSVGIPDGDEAPARFQEYGWIPGQLHSVVLFRFYGTRFVVVGEPTSEVGRELWTEHDLAVLWRGVGVRLVPRE